MKRILTVFAVPMLVTLICAGAYGAQKKQTAAPAKQTEANASPFSGKVVETMNGGGYTYVLLEKKGTKTWMAVPEMKVKVGQQMSFLPGSEMQNFTSKALNRTFKTIYFSGGPALQSAADDNKAVVPSAQMPAHGGRPAATASSDKIAVKKASGPDAHTIGDIFAKTASLDKKTVVVRGKVVKVSAGIMGKNWLHLQDGTGSPEKGTHDLVVTSDDTAAVGDVITVKGTIFKDKDFGAGYKYDVIMEQATIKR